MMALPLCILLLAFLCSGNAEKIVIDTDAGADDAGAILSLLRAESLRETNHQVVAITCTYGNTFEENVEMNVLKILTVAGRGDIPVYGGAKKPLIGNFSSDSYFGKDGFGDANFDRAINGEVDRSKHASLALVELAKQHEGDIRVVVLGPATNVAMAISLDPHFLKRVNKFHVMGALITGQGTKSPGVEFNVGADPESSFILFNSTTSSQLTLTPGDTNANMLKDWRKNVLAGYDSPYVAFMNDVERVSLESKQADYGLVDALTVSTLLWPQIATDILETNVQVVTDGAARGAVLVDYKQQAELRPFNAKIIRRVDVELYQAFLARYLGCVGTYAC